MRCNNQGIQDLAEDPEHFLFPCLALQHGDRKGLVVPILSDHAALGENLQRKIILKIPEEWKKSQSTTKAKTF